MKCYAWSMALCGAETWDTGQKLVKCYAWSMALCGAETWDTGQKWTESFEIW